MDGLLIDSKSMNLPTDTAPELKDRYECLLTAIVGRHPGTIYDEAKAFLECIFRTIILNRIGQIDEGRGHATFISLFEQAWVSLGIESDQFKDILKKSVEAVGNYRNNHGAVSHGQDGYSQRVADEEEAQYIAREALSIAGYFYSQHLKVSTDGQNERVIYEENEDFNEYLDSHEECVIAGVVMLASEVLYNNDPIAYKEQLIEYKQMKSSEEAYFEDMYYEQEADRMRGK